MRRLLLLGAVAALAAFAVPQPHDTPAVPLTAAGLTFASVDTVDVTPAADTLIVRTYDRVYARVVDSIGRRKSATVTWTVRDTNVVYISGRRTDSTGFYSAGLRSRSDTGRTYVVAQAGTKKDSSLWVVRDTTCSTSVLGSLDMGRDSAVLRRTDTIGVNVLPRNQCGGLMNGINVTWISSDTAGGASITRLDSLKGMIISVDSTGTTYIKATSGSLRDSIKIKHKGNL